MTIHHTRRGAGKPLILVHGLGSTIATWSLIAPALADHRELILVDLPGHGDSPAEADSGSFAGMVRGFDPWLSELGLAGTDMVGSSMGGRLVLEMARRGHWTRLPNRCGDFICAECESIFMIAPRGLDEEATVMCGDCGAAKGPYGEMKPYLDPGGRTRSLQRALIFPEGEGDG